MKRLFSLILICFISVSALFAKTWFVCGGSFSKENLAKERCELLSVKGYKVFIDEVYNDAGEKLYRVLFYDPMMLRDDARNRKTELMFSNAIQEIGINDLWICEADLPDLNSSTVFEPKEIVEEETDYSQIREHILQVMEEQDETPVMNIPEEPMVLETNKEVKLSEETPYSVLVRSYREEEKANIDRDRMLEQELNAYVLKKFDEEAFIKFDLHAGTFETYEEAEEYQEVLEDKGIFDTEVADYEDFAEELERFDEIVTDEEVTMTFGSLEIPDNISENVVTCISQFPINRDFEIVSATIVDLNNVRNSAGDYSELENVIPLERLRNDYFDSASYAKYRDNLFNKELDVYIMQAEESVSEIEDFFDYKETSGDKKDFQINYGILHSIVEEKYGDGIFLFGFTEDKKMAIIMKASNFTKTEFEKFMECSYSDSSLLVYPQIRRSFYVLPQNPSVNRDFIVYVLEQIDESYAEERNYSEWSIPIVGSWSASSIFEQDLDEIKVSFFDLDYDYNAERVHGMFMSEKYEKEISNSNKPVDVNGKDGWYMLNLRGGELSFAHNSYIVSIDSKLDGDLGLEDLYEFAEDLNIW